MTGWEYEAAYWFGPDYPPNSFKARIGQLITYITQGPLEANYLGTEDQAPPSSFDFSIHPYAEC